MISLDQARNQRLFLESLHESSWGSTAVEVLVLDIAEEISLEIGHAIEVAESLQAKGLATVAGAATPLYARVRISARGLRAAGERIVRRRAS